MTCKKFSAALTISFVFSLMLSCSSGEKLKEAKLEVKQFISFSDPAYITFNFEKKEITGYITNLKRHESCELEEVWYEKQTFLYTKKLGEGELYVKGICLDVRPSEIEAGRYKRDLKIEIVKN